ncbi:MAG: potassium channel family protein [Desulfatirhabdiaceae bacterium]
MIRHLLFAGLLLAGCVIIHALTLMILLRRLIHSPVLACPRFWPAIWLLIQVAWWMVFAHLLEIIVWATFYDWKAVFADIETSFYFSAVTYTTVGYGDVVPPMSWRLLAAVEGLTGILMCGWSAAFFYTVVSRMNFARSLLSESKTKESQ